MKLDLNSQLFVVVNIYEGHFIIVKVRQAYKSDIFLWDKLEDPCSSCHYPESLVTPHVYERTLGARG